MLQLLEATCLELVFPVFIFFFIAHRIQHPIISSNRRFWLFAPFLYNASLNVLVQPTVFGDSIPDTIKPIIHLFLWIGLFIAIVFIPTILAYAYRLIKKAQNVQQKKWLTYLWVLVFAIFFAFTLTLILASIFRFDIMPTMRVLSLFAAVLIHWIVYTGIYKFKLSDDQQEIKELINKRKNNNTKHLITDVSIPVIKDSKKVEFFTKDHSYFKKLEDLFENQHIYRDSALDRNKVAKMLGISPGYVSQLINTVTGNNFTTYINHYRVEAVKNLIVDKEFDHYSLLAIGLESGFSSKSTFHNAFKKITGMTPNAYRKKYK